MEVALDLPSGCQGLEVLLPEYPPHVLPLVNQGQGSRLPLHPPLQSPVPGKLFSKMQTQSHFSKLKSLPVVPSVLRMVAQIPPLAGEMTRAPFPGSASSAFPEGSLQLPPGQLGQLTFALRALLMLFLLLDCFSLFLLLYMCVYIYIYIYIYILVLPLYCYQPISLHPRAHMLSHVTPWTSARQTPLAMDFSRQEYWSGLPFPSLLYYFLNYFLNYFFSKIKTFVSSSMSLSMWLGPPPTITRIQQFHHCKILP